jgi:hypothetical protein
MTDDPTIEVGETEDGSVDLPIIDLLTGRGFVTGKSGSGKSNTASVIAEKLLDRGYGLLLVDLDGEYYGLKEQYELLHVGADEECDIQVSAEHAEKIAEMALGNNVPIILDVSSFLDESEAADLLTEIAKQLFAKGKKRKKPFLLVVEEIHEWIPEGGGMGECGRTLVKVAKRGRKHGLGVVGISQRPADVKKDFITQCDWLCWHRLTWRNDTRVVKRVLGSEYAEAVEELDDGEAFLVTDWSGETRRVQFHRKQTFDAGATPGLDDFERPDLKSVSADLVGELESITDEQRRREDRIEELERELREKERRIEILERDLEEARDLSQMADRFAEALFDHPGRSRMQLRSERGTERDESAHTADGGSGDGGDADAGVDPSGAPDATGDADARRAVEPAPSEQATLEENPGTEYDPGVEWPDPPLDDGGRSVGGDATADARSEDRPSGGRIVSTADGGRPDERGERGESDESDGEADRPVVRRVREVLSGLEPGSRRLLARYREDGPCSPLDAHVAAGGEGDRTVAYSHNADLREAGLIRHVGRGRYDYALPDLVAAAHDGRLSEAEVERTVAAIEDGLLDE